MSQSSFDTILKHACKQNGIVLNDTQIGLLQRYLQLMQKWNGVFNLTTITKPEEMVYLHIIDSLSIQPFLYGLNHLDVGSGAGLPGIPLAIVNPEQQWTLIDKNSKKTRFLQQAVAELNLKNVHVAHDNCENFHPAQSFDSIVCRALCTLEKFTSSTRHLLKNEGIWIAMKGKHPQAEIDELAGDIVVKNVQPLTIKGLTGERHVVLLNR